MKNDPIPDPDHISRYCGGATLTPSGQVSAASFLLRAGDEYLSVNWLEFLQLNNRDDELQEIRRILSTKITLGSRAKIAVLNVGEVKSHVRQNSKDRRNLRISHRPDEPAEKPDPSHSGIFDTMSDEQIVAELIAEAVLQTHSAR